MLSHMPEGDKEVTMIGGRYDQGKYNVTKILTVLARYKHDIFIDTSYICDNGYVFGESPYFFPLSCYELNTAFGDIAVDSSNLQVSCGYPSLTFPEPSNQQIEIPYSKWIFADELRVDL